MRSFTCLCLLAALIGGNTAACLAQQPTGPATLEGLLNSDEAKEPAVASEADAGPKPPAGTVARPKDGVQHPDLDKAWIDYDVAVGKAAGSIKAAINKQFDAATAKGDLDAAEKWQTALEKFEKAGEVPVETETKAAVSAAVADYKKAKDTLSKAYEAVVKSLTMEKKISEAKAARDEVYSIGAWVTPAKEVKAQGRNEQGNAAAAKEKSSGIPIVPKQFIFDGVWVCETNGWVGERVVRGRTIRDTEGAVGEWTTEGDQILIRWKDGGSVRLTLDPKNLDVLRGKNHRNTTTVWVKQK